MSAAIRRQRRRAIASIRCERGTTLIELLIYAVTSLFVFTAVITFLLVTFNQQNEISSRAVATGQAEQGLEQLVGDLRQAMTSVSISNPTTDATEIQFYVPTPGAPTAGELVSWTCPSIAEPSTYFAGTCTRVLTESGGTTITKTEISGVQSMAFAPISSSGTSMTTVTNSTVVASVGMTLKVQITSYEQDTHGTAPAILPGSSGAPIVVQATADLRNFA